MIKLIYYIIFLFTSLIAKSQNYCDFIQKVQNYQDYVKLKQVGDEDEVDMETFDVDIYLSLFNRIKVDKGYKIGMYYMDNFLDGNPYLYVLKSDQKLKDKSKEYFYNFLNKAEFKAKNHISPKDSEEGFLQYLFFYEMGEQFALKWHSCYNSKFIICNKKKQDEVINDFKKYNIIKTDKNNKDLPAFQVDLQALNKFAEIDPAIEFELTKEFCTITWIEDRTHKGIYKCKYKIQRHLPYKIEKIYEELLLDIKIGFIY